MKRVTIGRRGDVLSLNPILYTDLETGEVLNRIFDHLVLTDDEQQYVPGRLITRWERSADGMTWDFHLRPESRWHDGAPVTAADAAFTFRSIIDPATGSKRRPEFLVDGQPVEFEAVDRWHLRARLPGPHPSFLASLAWRPVIPQHRYGAAGQDGAPIGSGAFVFAERRPGDRLVMRANRRYHLGRPPLDEVVWRCFPDQDAAALALVEDDVDYVPGIPPRLAAELESLPGVVVVRSLDASFTYLGFQLQRPLFRDSRVRRAIGHAVDREAIVREVLRGEGSVAHSMVVPTSAWHNPSVRRYAYDPAEAGRLLDAAGWHDVDGVRRNDRGDRFAFTLLTIAGDDVKERSAAAVAADCARVGIDVRVQALEMGALLRDHVYPRRFDAVLMALAPNPDPAYLHAFYHSELLTPNGWNRLGYRNLAVDQLLERSRAELDLAARRALVHEAQALIVADMPHVLLFHPVAVDAASERLRLPRLPRTPANRFMYLHRWDVQPTEDRSAAIVQLGASPL